MQKRKPEIELILSLLFPLLFISFPLYNYSFYLLLDGDGELAASGAAADDCAPAHVHAQGAQPNVHAAASR